MTSNILVTSIVTGNYEENSTIQREVINITLSYVRQAVDVLAVTSSSSSLIIADFGSAYGQNSIHVIKFIIEYLKQSRKINDEKQVLVVHNDLPANNWLSLFESLKIDQSYHALISGRSFYEQCLPKNYLTVGYSSNSMHWLSRKPCNIRNHSFGVDGDEKEKELFRQQSKEDLVAFLEHRSNELINGGVLILSIPSAKIGIQTVCHTYGRCMDKWIQLLLTEEESFNFTIPVHFRTFDECVDLGLLNQLSFELVAAEMITTRFPMFEQYRQGQLTIDQLAKQMVTGLRVCCDSVLRQAMSIGRRTEEEMNEISNRIWTAAEEDVKTDPFKLDVPLISTLLVLKKLH